jgi:hypothetical protein
MTDQFCTVHNFNEEAIFCEVGRAAAQYPEFLNQPQLLADVACIALNRMPPRYICHDVDTIFYMSDHDRSEHATAVTAAVAFAIGFVQSRAADRTA